MRRTIDHLLPVVLASVIASLVAGCTDQASSSVESVTQPVLQGKPCATCQWPTALNGGGCTVTLVHPRVITTAKHCGTPRQITFGENRNMVTRRATVERCFQAASGDFAFCTLTEAINDVPIVPLLSKCEAERVIKPGTKIVIVGFGQLEDGRSSGGRKHYGETVIINVLGNGSTVALGDGMVASCFGDSGGPAYVQMPDGTWRMFGSTSGAYGGGGCPGRSRYNYIPYHLAWMEQQSGIDLTPCHDGNGGWDPTPACGAIPTNPGEGVGTWADMCKAISMAPAQNVCTGAPPPPPGDGGGGRGGAGGGGGGGGGRDAGGGGGTGGRDGGGGTARDAGGAADRGGGGAGGAGGGAGGQGGGGEGGGAVTPDAAPADRAPPAVDSAPVIPPTPPTPPPGTGGAGGSPPAGQPPGGGCSCALGAAAPEARSSRPNAALSGLFVMLALAGVRSRRRRK